jgi:hypothetical protein
MSIQFSEIVQPDGRLVVRRVRVETLKRVLCRLGRGNRAGERVLKIAPAASAGNQVGDGVLSPGARAQ